LRDGLRRGDAHRHGRDQRAGKCSRLPHRRAG
jgi:hypothetical protein